MRPSMIRVLIRLVALTAWLCNSGYAEAAPVSSPKAPAVVVELAKFGWAPPPNVSNRAIFKDFTLAKLFAMDRNTRLVFLSEEVIAVYHTKEEGKDWRTVPRIMEAFFIRAKDGSLVSTQRWAGSVRKSMDEHVDSEARLIPLHDGRFLVFANGIITLYGPNLELLKQKQLEPLPSTDFWSAQSVADGREIFLRRESISKRLVTYSWLASDTLEAIYQLPSYPWQYTYRGFPMQDAVRASENAIFGRGSGIQMIDRDQRVKTICEDPLCKESGALHVLSSRYIGWSGRTGIGIVDAERGGFSWAKLMQPQYRSQAFQFGEMRSAMSGTKFALWVTANKKVFFDEVEIKPITFLVYDLAKPNNHPAAIRMKGVRPDWDFSLSPNGTKLALFDGAKVQIYSLE
jgi:hypothetical protein